MNNEKVLYENIKKRRQELSMSQQELAEAVGYSGKSMISQVEKGMIDLPSTMITKFANALNCTESYLMGWEDLKPDIDYQIDIGKLSMIVSGLNNVPDAEEYIKRALAYYSAFEKL